MNQGKELLTSMFLVGTCLATMELRMATQCPATDSGCGKAQLVSKIAEPAVAAVKPATSALLEFQAMWVCLYGLQDL